MSENFRWFWRMCPATRRAAANKWGMMATWYRLRLWFLKNPQVTEELQRRLENETPEDW